MLLLEDIIDETVFWFLRVIEVVSLECWHFRKELEIVLLSSTFTIKLTKGTTIEGHDPSVIFCFKLSNYRIDILWYERLSLMGNVFVYVILQARRFS